MGVIMLADSSALGCSAVLNVGKAQAVVSKVTATRAQKVVRFMVVVLVYGAVLVSITPVGDDTYETTLSLDRRIVNDLRSLYIAQLSTKRY